MREQLARAFALTVAGSDSGGGAGIQADHRTFYDLGVWGTSAVTALTAQNPREVVRVQSVPPEFVVSQIDAVMAYFPVTAAKTGMLWSPDVVEAVATIAASAAISHWVIDPVLVSTSGASLLESSAIDGYRSKLIPQATLCTPNLVEARILLSEDTAVAHEETVRALVTRFEVPFLLKGGHSVGAPQDFFWDGSGKVRSWQHQRVPGEHHGTGCTLSAAITAHLALGHSLMDACSKGVGYVQSQLREKSATP